jgi:hypothetical protein
MPIIFSGPHEQIKNIPFTIYTFMLTLDELGGVMLPTLFTRIIIHPNTIHMKHCPPQQCSMKILFIIALSPEIPTLFTIFILFTPTLFTILTAVGSFSFSKFLLLKIR